MMDGRDRMIMMTLLRIILHKLFRVLIINNSQLEYSKSMDSKLFKTYLTLSRSVKMSNSKIKKEAKLRHTATKQQ